MKVVVAGGSGLIGRRLCATLLQAGHEPVVLSRRASIQGLGAGVRVQRWQPPEQGEWAAVLDGAGAVVNLAGASIGTRPWTSGRRRLLRESRLDATAALVDAIAGLPADRRPSVLVNGSGSDVYEGLDAIAADEDTPPAGTFLARLCVDWEAEARRAEALGLRVVLLRTCLVVGRGAPALRIQALPFRFFLGGPLGSGRQWASWIDVDDAARLIAWAIETPSIDGPLNLASPDARRQADFAVALGRALHRPSWFRTPGWLIRLVLRDQATLALGSRYVRPAKALAAGFEFSRPDLDDALRAALG